MDPNELLICKNCGNHFSGKFCNACGEKVYGPKDKSVMHLFEEAFHFISHFEGKLLLTLKTMFTQPGRFAADYCNGIRKKYFKPISLFLLIVVLYLLFPLAKGLNLSVGDHVQSWYGVNARKAALHYMERKQVDEKAFVMRYDASSEKVSKILLFVLIPVMAGFARVFNIQRKGFFFDDLIFSIETTSFFLLWGFLIVPVLVRLAALLIHIPEQTDIYTLPANLVASLLYVFVASRRFYHLSSPKAGIFALLFMTILPLFAHYIYSCILFFVTISLLH
jgi:hypothetical protein